MNKHTFDLAFKMKKEWSTRAYTSLPYGFSLHIFPSAPTTLDVSVLRMRRSEEPISRRSVFAINS